MMGGRHELAVASEPGPGSPAVEVLAEKVTAARRRMTGLSDALDAAHRDLLDALGEHRETFEADLDVDQIARRERAIELIAELAANIAAAGEPATAVRWMGLATNPERTWSGLYVAPREVFVQGQGL